MKIFSFRYITALLVISFLVSCHTSWQTESLQYKSYRINQTVQTDATVASIIKPYGDSVNKSMNDVIGVTEAALDKAQPEGALGDFMVDAYFAMAKIKYNQQVDGAVMNFGGIRLTQLAAGNITRGKVFELMPFDNLLILQKMKGSVLQQFLDLVAGRGGWPLANITMQIKDKKAVNVMIGGQPLDPQKEYTIANSDFVANGGDNADMLRAIPQQTNGYLMRDAIIDYILSLKAQGRNVQPAPLNRVSNAQ